MTAVERMRRRIKKRMKMSRKRKRKTRQRERGSVVENGIKIGSGD